MARVWDPVLTVMTIHTTAFWLMTACFLMGEYQHFERIKNSGTESSTTYIRSIHALKRLKSETYSTAITERYSAKIIWSKKGKAIPVTGREDPQGWRRRGSHIFYRHSTHRLRDVASLTHRPPFTRGTFLVLIPLKRWVDPRAIMRLEGLSQLKKNPWHHRETNQWPYCL
jgi:hypothetical protein